MNRHRAKLGEWLSLDLRSLAAFRIAAGLFLLVDLVWKATDLVSLYTDQGVLPRGLLASASPSGAWSLHALGGSTAFEAALFILNGLAIAALLAGFKTRLATLLCWLFLVSLNNRNPLILQAGDAFLGLGLLWSVFLPLGAVWSLDALRSPAPPKRIVNAASCAFLLQVVLVYWLTAYFKLRYAAWWNGDALSQVFRLEEFATPTAMALSHWDTLDRVLTRATVWFEILGPFLLFSPVATGPVRLACVAAFWGLHASFALCLQLGSFPWISGIMMIPLLPSWFWQRIGSRPGGSAPPQPWTIGRIELARQAAVVLLFLLMAWSLLPTVDTRYRLPGHWSRLTRGLRLGQSWAMFASLPETTGWYVARATLADGSTIDLLRPASPGLLDRPPLPSAIYPDWHWRKIVMDLSRPRYKALLPLAARRLAARYQRAHPRSPHVAAVSLLFVSETFLDPRHLSPPTPHPLWEGPVSVP